jgi:polyketide synthase PksN
LDEHHLIADYGIDSLHLLELLTRISRHYQIDLSISELADVETVADLAELIVHKANGVATRDGARPKSAARTHPALSDKRTRRLAASYAHAFSACNGFRQHLLERADGGTTEILDIGSGPPILLLPPMGCIGAAFLYQARYLAQTYRLLTFHYPGYGRSSVSGREDLQSAVTDIAQCLRHLARDTGCHVMGWSLGGIVGQMFAAVYPGLVKSLILVNTGTKLNGDGSLASAATMAQLFMDDFEQNMPDWMRDRPEGKLDFIKASDSAVGAARFMAAVHAFDARDRLAAITVPALVVSGGRDRIMPARQGRDLAERLSGSTYRELATAGHYIPLFNADWFNRQTAAFIGAMKV